MIETDENPNLEKLCRLCTEQQNEGNLIDIFDMEINKNVSIPMRIMACAALEVQKNDELPKLICKNCRYLLEKSYYFRKRCQAADAKLRKHIRLLNLGKKSRVFVKSNDDFDDEALEFEESIHLIESHEKELRNDWKKEFEKDKDKEMREYEKNLEENIKEQIYASAVETARKSLEVSLREEIENELRNSLSDEIKTELQSKLQESNEITLRKFKDECRNNEINRLFMDLEEFLSWKSQKCGFSSKKQNKTAKNVNVTKSDNPETANDSLLRVTRSRKTAGASLLLPQKLSLTAKSQADDTFVDTNQDDVMTLEENLSDNEQVVEADGDVDADADADADGDDDADGEEYFTFVEETVEDDEHETETQTLNDEHITEINYKNNDTSSSIKKIKKNFKVENCKSNNDDLDIMIFSYSENDDNDNTENEQEMAAEDELYDEVTSIDENLEYVNIKERNSNVQNKRKPRKKSTNILSTENTENKLTLNVVEPIKLKTNDILSFAQSSDTPKSYGCDLCPITFSTKNQLNRHQKNHKRTELKGVSYQCEHCNIYFSCRSSLLRHQVIHTGQRPYVCEICNKSFIQREILKRHMNIHKGLRPYKCPHCERSYAQKVNLKQHINTNHLKVPAVQLHSCHLCTKRFNHASGLSRHLTLHAGVMYQCSECTRTFNDRSSIKRHITNMHGRTNVEEVDYNKIEINSEEQVK